MDELKARVSDLGRSHGNLKRVAIEQENKVKLYKKGCYGFYQLCRPCFINIDPNSSVSRTNSDFCTCKFKLIAFLDLRANVKVWLRETNRDPMPLINGRGLR